MIYEKMVPNSYVYEYVGLVKNINDKIINRLNYKNILVNIGGKYHLFTTKTKDFSFKEIEEIYNKEQIYINIKNKKTSCNFLSDYRKLKKRGYYFEVEKKNLFRVSEEKIKKILEDIFIGKCLDIGCGDLLYKDIFHKNGVEYLGIDIHRVNNGLNILEVSFEEFYTNDRYDVIFFFRSINHFFDTENIINKAYLLLNKGGKIFIIENEAFGEIKFKNQMFEGKKNDFEHFHNYTLDAFKKVIDIKKFNILKEEKVTNNSANQWYILLEKK